MHYSIDVISSLVLNLRVRELLYFKKGMVAYACSQTREAKDDMAIAAETKVLELIPDY